MNIMDIIADIRARLERCPVAAGEGTTVPALPAPENVPEGTMVYRRNGHMIAASHPDAPEKSYAVPAPPRK